MHYFVELRFYAIITISNCTYNAIRVLIMIDYKTIGAKIRKRRLEAGLSQERLAELCDVGTTHISHIETGNCIPSLKTFIAIINALSCSADELLCDELSNAQHTYSSEISNLLEDCNSRELMVMADTLVSLKNSLRKLPASQQSP